MRHALDLSAPLPETGTDPGLLLERTVQLLFEPLEAGCALVRDAGRLRAAFAYHPPYYHFDERATNFVDYGPQNSRGFRALKVWLAPRHAGAAGYRASIAEDIPEIISRERGIFDSRSAPGGRSEGWESRFTRDALSAVQVR